MLTSQLNAELKRFGLKAVPRRKACRLLNHIYEQTHPLVPSPATSQMADDQNSREYEDRDPPLTHDSGASLQEQLGQFVKDRPSLHQMILLYEPVVLGELYTQVRAAGVKCTRAQLQVSRRCISGFKLFCLKDWLDLECITNTYKLNHRAKNGEKKKKKKKRVKRLKVSE